MFICLVGQLSNSSTNPNQVSYDNMMVNMGSVDLYWLQNSIEFMD